MTSSSLLATRPADEGKVFNAKAEQVSVVRSRLITSVSKSQQVQIYLKDIDQVFTQFARYFYLNCSLNPYNLNPWKKKETVIASFIVFSLTKNNIFTAISKFIALWLAVHKGDAPSLTRRAITEGY